MIEFRLRRGYARHIEYDIFKSFAELLFDDAVVKRIKSNRTPYPRTPALNGEGGCVERLFKGFCHAFSLKKRAYPRTPVLPVLPAAGMFIFWT